MEEGTKAVIRRSLIALMQTCDVDRITVVDLVDQANVSRSTFYRHYDSVDAVLKEMEQDFLDRSRAINHNFISSGINREKSRSGTDDPNQLFDLIRENKDFYLAVTGPHGDPQFQYRFNALVREFYGGKMMYERLVKEDSDAIIEFALGGHAALIRYWLTERLDMSAEKVSHLAQRLMFQGFLQ